MKPNVAEKLKYLDSKPDASVLLLVAELFYRQSHPGSHIKDNSNIGSSDASGSRPDEVKF
jgi:hypothetical protein